MACKTASNSRNCVCTRDDELETSYNNFFENYVPAESVNETEEVTEIEFSETEVDEITEEVTEEIIDGTAVA